MSFQPQARYAALSGYGALSDSLGLDWAPLMRSAGLDPAGLAVQDRWIPAAAVARLLEISASASGREDFGLRLAGFRQLANLGPLALVIREEPDVRSVLEMLIRYEHAYNQAISISLSEADGLATIRVDLDLGEPAGTRQATELAVGALHHILWGSITGSWPGRTSRLGSSLGDHFGRLPARSLSARLPDGADPASGV